MTHTNISQIMFKVKGCYDAILYFLSRDGLYTYKFGIENGNGTFSKITKFSSTTGQQIGKIVQNDTSKEDLMACNEYRFLWIRWSAGEIYVGAGMSFMESIFLNVHDDGAIPGLEISHISSFADNLTWVFGGTLLFS